MHLLFLRGIDSPALGIGSRARCGLELCGYVQKSGKGLPQQAEVALGVSGRLRPRIFLTFGTTRVVGRQLYAPASFTPGEISGTHF